jgi:hypothetical protein
MRLLTVLLATTLMVSLQPSASQAGYRAPDEASCTKPFIDNNGQSVGGCSGTMKGFADSPDPQAYAGLRVRANGTMFFEAHINGVTFTCFFPDTFDSQYLASFAGDLQNGRFAISARAGICSEFSMVERGTLYNSY